jgi:hypothetical protein
VEPPLHVFFGLLLRLAKENVVEACEWQVEHTAVPDLEGTEDWISYFPVRVRARFCEHLCVCVCVNIEFVDVAHVCT